jgi:hypothetical protein
MWTIYDGLPDNTISEQDMLDYGFTDRTMLPIAAQSAALNIFKETDLKLYALGADNSKSLIESEAELSTWIGIFGVNKAEWRDFLVNETEIVEDGEQDNSEDELER